MIDPVLTTSLARLEAHFLADDRCLAMYLWGSLGAGTADEFSDVDVAIVVRDEAYAAVRAELRGICERLCGPVLVWLPEGEKAQSGNVAFLYEESGKVLLYDCFLSAAAKALDGPGAAPKVVLFDRAGLFAAEPIKRFASPDLLQEIDHYWVYMYLNGKYFRRQDVFKMLYVQGVLLNGHLSVLRAMLGAGSASWWAQEMHALPEAHQEELLIYFPAPAANSIAAALWRKMDLFAAHGRAACARQGLEYPAALEEGVRRHLRDMFRSGYPNDGDGS